jgi:hypothetical protein
MEFKVTSRRDDFISLLYMLFHILNNFKTPGLNYSTSDSMRSDEKTNVVFDATKKHKK